MRQLRVLLYEGLSVELSIGSVIGRTTDLQAHAPGVIRVDSLVELENIHQASTSVTVAPDRVSTR
jgi:hypothetical protein